MKKALCLISLILFFISCASKENSGSTSKAVYGPTKPEINSDYNGVRYFGSVIELKDEKEKLYRELHADVWPEVRQAIAKANIRNYHIYLSELEGKKFLFSFFEYHGKDMDKDFASIAKDPVTRDKWWPITDGCQERLPGTPEGSQWMNLESLMHIK